MWSDSGSTTSDLTVSYSPSELLTYSNNPEGGYAYVPINYATLFSNCTSRHSCAENSDQSCEATVTISDATYSFQISTAAADELHLQDHCYPQLPSPYANGLMIGTSTIVLPTQTSGSLATITLAGQNLRTTLLELQSLPPTSLADRSRYCVLNMDWLPHKV